MPYFSQVDEHKDLIMCFFSPGVNIVLEEKKGSKYKFWEKEQK